MSQFDDLVNKVLNEPDFVNRLKTDAASALKEVNITTTHHARVQRVVNQLDWSHIEDIKAFIDEMKVAN